MNKFVIKDDFWQIFPEGELFIIAARGIDNSKNVPEIDDLLTEANKNAVAHLTCENFTDNTPVRIWRDAYTKFRTKKGARCSIEALLKRISKGGEIGSINPLVNLYNSVSLNFALPCGGEDIDTFKGEFRLTVADGGESFMALGDEENKPALPGEVIYRDDEGAVCRCWNWRDGQRTMLTEKTTNAFLVIESAVPGFTDKGMEAIDFLASNIEEYLGGECTKHFMNIENKEIEF